MRLLHILTVGEGDFSLSLALARAYGRPLHVDAADNLERFQATSEEQKQSSISLQLTATTLLASRDELLRTYPQAATIIKELEEIYKVPVYFGVDATQLDTYQHLTKDGEGFDLVAFHHPHLGDYNECSEETHLQRHHVLLCHYLSSARQCLSSSGRIHVALKDDQAIAWKLEAASKRNCLVQTLVLPVQRPFHHVVGVESLSVNTSTMTSATRRSRRAKTASKHWLAKYGYTFQRTFPKTRVSSDLPGSRHYVFCPDSGVEATLESELVCISCGLPFEKSCDLQRHVQNPAVPSPPAGRSAPSMDGREESPCSEIDADKVKNEVELAGGEIDTSNGNEGQQELVEAPVPLELDGENSRLLVTEVIVKEEFAGKRLRWFLQHCLQAPAKRSKKDCERWIAGGYIQVNGDIALDSSRVLHPGFLVIITLPNEGSAKGPVIPLRVVESWNPACHVVQKPVGMRTVGNFDGTLEWTFSCQQGRPHKSLSNLDTGCSGLCVIRELSCSAEMHVCHSFSALVFGLVPKSWRDGVRVLLPVDSMRRWRRSKDSDQQISGNGNTDSEAIIKMVEQTDTDENGTPKLSTISVSTSCKTSGLASVICFYLRKTADHPVVGDRFATTEYLSLPRSMKNRLKQRLCIGCTAVSTTAQSTAEDIPDKWRALYWQHHFSQSTRIPSG